MRIQIAVPDRLPEADRKAAIDAALEAVTLSNVPMVANRSVPLASAAIKAGRVRWKPEPPGDEHFDLATTQMVRGWGDCDDLAPWHAASLRATGTDPGARAIVVKSGPTRWHAVVKRSDGSIDDPSRHAGMGSKVSGHDDVVGGIGPFVRHMQPNRLMVASHPMAGGRWAARADVPALCYDDHCEPWSWSSTQAAHNPIDAVRGACHGLMQVAGNAYLDDTDHARIAGIYDLLSGVAPGIVGELLDGLTDGEVTLENLRPGVSGILGSHAIGAYGMGDIDQAFHDAQVFVGMAFPNKPPALYDAIERVKNLTKAGQFHEAQVLTGQIIPVGNVKAPIRQAVYDAIDLCIQNQPGRLSKAARTVADTASSAIRSAASAALPFAAGLIPGGSALMNLAQNVVPAVSSVFKGVAPAAAAALVPGSRGGGRATVEVPGQTISIPGGPVVVRF